MDGGRRGTGVPEQSGRVPQGAGDGAPRHTQRDPFGQEGINPSSSGGWDATGSPSGILAGEGTASRMLALGSFSMEIWIPSPHPRVVARPNRLLVERSSRRP